MLNENTFGDSPAAVTLSNLINSIENAIERKKISSKVSYLLISYFSGLKMIESNFDKLTISGNMLELWKDSYFIKCQQMKIPNILKSYLTNVISYRYRMALHNYREYLKQFKLKEKEERINNDTAKKT